MTFTVFGYTGYWYGLIFGLGVLAYLGLAGVLGFHKRLPAGAIRLFGLIGLPMSLIFARIGFCAVNFGYYTDTVSQPFLMLHFWDGGYSFFGMLIGLVIATFLTARIRKVRFGSLLDVTTAPLMLLVIGARIAEAFSDGQLGIGRQVEESLFTQLMPWLFVQEKMGTLVLFRLAVYRYEAAVALMLLVPSLWLFFSRRQRRRAHAGDVAMIIYALYGAVQVVLESLRDDGHMVAGFIRVQQVGYIALPVLAMIIFCARYSRIREISTARVTAWVALPIAALVGVLMVKPLNHVLDLTDKRMIGGVVLAFFALYFILFLRLKRVDWRLVVMWLVILIAIAGCVMVEFSVDGSDNLLRDYGVMAGCCVLIFMMPYGLWRTLENRVYREERIRVQIKQV